jgi:peptidyl-dipeptidase A
MEEKEAQKFVDKITKKIKPLMKSRALAYFNALISGKEEFYKQYEKTQIKLEKIFNKKEDFDAISKFYNSDIKNNLLKRQILILKNYYLGSQGDMQLIKKIVKLSANLEKRFNKFRAKINGKEFTDNEIKEILRAKIENSEVKKAWVASKKQGALVSKNLIKLVNLRNELAKSLGFENYYQLSLEVHEQKEEEIEKIFKKVEENTNISFKTAKEEIDNFLSKRFKISKNKLKPWHYQNLFFQEAPKIYHVNLDEYYQTNILEIAKKFYEDIGMNILPILKNSDLYEHEGKYQHACCIDIDREGDTRIIVNLKNNEYWMKTLLHELGHGIYDLGYAKELLPFLLKNSAHIFLTEAIAQFFERESLNINFIKKYSQTKINDEDILKLKEARKELRLEEIVFCRWSLVMFNFERELYKNPKQDLNNLWWDLVKKYQGIDFYRDKQIGLQKYIL